MSQGKVAGWGKFSKSLEYSYFFLFRGYIGKRDSIDCLQSKIVEDIIHIINSKEIALQLGDGYIKLPSHKL